MSTPSSSMTFSTYNPAARIIRPINTPAAGCRRQFPVRASGVDVDRKKIAVGKKKSGLRIDYTGEKPDTPLLDTINYPIHMKNLTPNDLEQLAVELRAELVYTVSKTGGHLSSSLGVVELAVAIHHVFNAPDDKIIWDVGHQVPEEK